MSQPVSHPGTDPAPELCAEVQALARQAIIYGESEGRPEAVQTALPAGLPAGARAHAETCLDCRREVSETARLDTALGGALRGVRSRIPQPSLERVESILAGSTPSPQAALLRRTRRTVNRLLWLTFLALSLLPLSALAIWLARVLTRLGAN